MEDYVYIGRMGKTHGTAGELKCFVEDDFVDDFLDAQAVFLALQGKKVPFFIDSSRGENTLIIKFEEVDSREDALPLAGCEIFLRQEDISDGAGEDSPDFSFLEGFLIIDQQAGEVGAIEQILEFPQQIMAVLLYQGRELLIPLNDEFIIQMDEPAKRILMDLPDGLLEL
jgi:16S rRNA processing protein RimM